MLDADVADAERAARTSEILRDLFRLPSFVSLDNDYSCAIADGILWHGRLYVTSDAVCFYSNILSRETKHVVPYAQIRAVNKRATALFIPALEILVGPTVAGGERRAPERRLLLSSFAVGSRDAALAAIERRWHAAPVENSLANAVVLAPESRPTGPHRSRRSTLTAEPSASSAAPATGDSSSAGRVRDGRAAGGRGTTAAPTHVDVDRARAPTPSSLAPGEVRTARAASDVGVPVGLSVEPPPDARDDAPAAAAQRMRTLGDSLLLPLPPAVVVPLARVRSHSLSARAADAVAAGAATAAPDAVDAAATVRAGDATALLLNQPPRPPPHAASASKVRPAASAAPLQSAAMLRRSSSASARGPSTAPPPPPTALLHRLAAMLLVVDAVLPISVEGFHDAFVSDDADVLSAAGFHLRRGDTGVSATRWVDSPSVGGGGGASATGAGSAGEPLVTRTLRMRMPLVSAIPGAPSETAIEKQQRCAYYAAGDYCQATPMAAGGSTAQQRQQQRVMLVVETAARAADVPYGDYFVTEDCTLVAPVDAVFPDFVGHEAAPEGELDAALTAVAPRSGGGGGAAARTAGCCRVLVFVRVTFSKFTVLKGVITRSGEARAASFHRDWVTAARLALVTSRRAGLAAVSGGAAPAVAAGVVAAAAASGVTAAAALRVDSSAPAVLAAASLPRQSAAAARRRSSLLSAAAAARTTSAQLPPAALARSGPSLPVDDGGAAAAGSSNDGREPLLADIGESSRSGSEGGEGGGGGPPALAAAATDSAADGAVAHGGRVVDAHTPTLHPSRVRGTVVAAQRSQLLPLHRPIGWAPPSEAAALPHTELLEHYARVCAAHAAMEVRLRRAEGLGAPDVMDRGDGKVVARVAEPHREGTLLRWSLLAAALVVTLLFIAAVRLRQPY